MDYWEREGRWLAEHLVNAGYSVRIYDGEEWAYGRPSDDLAFIVEHSHRTDDEVWFVFKDGEAIGWLSLVWGNGPGELISSHAAGEELEAAYSAFSRRFPI